MTAKKNPPKKSAAKKSAPKKTTPPVGGEPVTVTIEPDNHTGSGSGAKVSATVEEINEFNEELKKPGAIQRMLAILRSGQTRGFQPISASAGSGGRDLGANTMANNVLKEEKQREEGQFVNDIKKIEVLVAKQLPHLRNLKEALASVGVFQQPEGSIEKEVANLESITTGRAQDRPLASHLLDVQEALRVHSLLLQDIEAHAIHLFRR